MRSENALFGDLTSKQLRPQPPNQQLARSDEPKINRPPPPPTPFRLYMHRCDGWFIIILCLFGYISFFTHEYSIGAIVKCILCEECATDVVTLLLARHRCCLSSTLKPEAPASSHGPVGVFSSIFQTSSNSYQFG